MSKNSGMQGKNRRNWRLLTVATVLFFIVSGVYFLLDSTRETKRLEQNLIDRFGWANDYTPAVDGSVPAERVEGFIRVREALQPACVDYQKAFDAIIALDKVDGSEELSSREKTSVSIKGIKSMFSTPGNFLAFMNTRNIRLMEEEMGIGEYLYLYLSAYGEQLANDSDSRYANIEEASLSPRARNEFIEILENQLAALEASDVRASLMNVAAGLRREISALKDGTHVSPWPAGAMGLTRESFAPYREQITSLYCSGIVRVELQQKNRGLNFGG